MLRYALAPRWWFMHLVVLALAVGCIRLGAWQWQVAHVDGQLQWRNAIYAVQWWVFAVLGVAFWGRFLRDQRLAERAWWDLQAQQAATASGDEDTDSVLP